MLVFRICKEEEITKINNSDELSNVGSFGKEFIEFQKEKNINNHTYDFEKRYMHFFEDKWSILYWKPIKGRYVCTYDIPDEVLNEGAGYGNYLSVFNYDRDVQVKEYSVESSKIKKEYLTKVEIIKEDIDICDDDFPTSLDEYLDVVFEKGKARQLIRGKQESRQ